MPCVVKWHYGSKTAAAALRRLGERRGQRKGHEMNDVAGARCKNYSVGLPRPASDAPARTFSRALSRREEICSFA